MTDYEFTDAEQTAIENAAKHLEHAMVNLAAAAEHKARRGGGPGSLTEAGARLLNRKATNR